jgi:hypothetical protein
MSGYSRQTNDEELRLRQAQGFSVGATQATTVVNPGNVVLFNPLAQAKNVFLDKFLFSSSVVQQITVFGLTADPGLAASITPGCRQVGAAAGVALHEFAIAAVPAHGAQLGFIITVLGDVPVQWQPPLYNLPAGTGLLFSFQALAATVAYWLSWYELAS